MSTNDQMIPTDNLGKPIPKTTGSKVIHINGRSKFRGDPSPMTSKDKIGEDGKEDKFTISTVEEFDLNYRQEGIQKISNFFVTDLVHEQVGRLAENIDQLFSDGKQTGPVVLCKIKGPKRPYWTLLSEENYNKSDKVIKKESN